MDESVVEALRQPEPLALGESGICPAGLEGAGNSFICLEPDLTLSSC